MFVYNPTKVTIPVPIINDKNEKRKMFLHPHVESVLPAGFVLGKNVVRLYPQLVIKE